MSKKSYVVLNFCPFSKNLKIKIYKTIILHTVLYECEAWSHAKGKAQIEGV
jgi:hypothetical protein